MCTYNSLIAGPLINSKISLLQSLDVFSILKIITVLVITGIAVALYVVLTVRKLQNQKSTSGSSVVQREGDHAVEFSKVYLIYFYECSLCSLIFRIFKIKYQLVISLFLISGNYHGARSTMWASYIAVPLLPHYSQDHVSIVFTTAGLSFM